jgi:hypothetical protein
MLLAAVLTLTRKNSILLPDRPVDPTRAAQAIEPKELLRDWDARDMHTLLGRALFDEATYGRVQFHHRSVREYLTARWLLYLLERGKPRRAVEGLLFAHRYGLDIVIPSMKPIAAWLALWDERVRTRMLTIAPEILIEHGDPAGLPVDIRAQLLRQFASLNAGRSDTGASFDMTSVRRLADPRLAATALDLLNQYRENEDVRQLLLRTVEQGHITDCAESALSFALDTTMDPHTRICGIRALGAAGNKNQKRRLAEAILLNIADWEKQELGAAMRALFPDTLTMDELLTILEFVKPPPTYSVTLLDLDLEEIVSSNCSPPQRESLLIGLVGLLEREPHIEPRYCEVSQRYAWLLGYVAKLAERIILDTDARLSQFSDALLRAIELQAQGQEFHDGYHRPDHKLDDLVRERQTLLHALFWRAVERQRKELSAEGKRLTDWGQVRPEAPALQFSTDDVEMFLADVRGRTSIDDRLVALTAAFALWRNRSQGEQDYERMWSAVQGDSDLEARLHTLLHPEPLSEAERRPLHSGQDFRQRQAERRAQHEEVRLEHIARLRGNSDRIRSVDQKTVQQVFGELYGLGQEILRLTHSLALVQSDGNVFAF